MKKFIPVILFCSFLNADFVESNDIVLRGIKGSDKTPEIYDCKNRVDCIYFEGEITNGDYEKFEEALVNKLKKYYLDVYEKTSQNFKYFFNNPLKYDSSNYINSGLFIVFINSSGGSVQESLKIAKLLRGFETTVQIPMDGVCNSACFYLFSSGMSRLGDQNTIGIHSPSFEKKAFNELSQSEADFLYKGMEAEAYNLLRDFNIPEKFISKMQSITSDDLYFLSREERNELLFDRIYKERMISMGTSFSKLSNNPNPTSYESIKYGETIRFFLLKNLSSKFPTLIENESLGNILADTIFFNAFSADYTLKYFEIGDKRPYEDQANDALLKFSKEDPEGFLQFSSVAEGLRDTTWYEALLHMNALRYYSDEMIQDLYLNKSTILGEPGDSVDDLKYRILALLLLTSFKEK